MELVGEIGGVQYIDDSKGTNVDATVKAIQTLKRETVLLLGGKNKGYDYTKLFAAMRKSSVVHAVLYGENRYELLKCAREQGFEDFSLCNRFTFAVQIAVMQAKSGQAVLLSPASASFDEFASYEERGDTFVQIVRSLTAELYSETQEENTDANDEPCKNDNAADIANDNNDVVSVLCNENQNADDTE